MSALERRKIVVPPRRRNTGSTTTNPGQSASFAGARYGRPGYGAMRPAVLGLAKLLFLPVVSAAPLGLWQHGVRILEEDAPKSAADPQLYAFLGIAVALVLGGGVFAGLTIALMGQDETYLQVLATSGEGSERKHAAAVLKLLSRGKHWVLVTLLLSNVITNETLPIVLDRSLGGGWPAVLSSTVLIVIFGEVAPQSVCVRYGLSIGAAMAPVVLCFMWILSPIAWPIAKLLDYLLGEDHGTSYKKAGLKTLVQLHKTLGTTPGERLMEDEVNIIASVLDLKDKRVDSVMTPMQDVFTMSADTVLDERMMETILSQGYSRIPIYAPDNHRNYIGMLLVKILITYDPEDAQRVRDFALATLPETHPYTSCLDIINFFQEGKSHMVLVSDDPGTDHGAMGVVTLEDVIEELIGEEIVDESDVFIDVHKAIRRMAPADTTRYRMSRGNKLVEVDDNVVSESEREGDNKADGVDAPLLQTESRKSSVANGRPGLQSMGTTFLMRRKSSNASEAAHEPAKPTPMRSNTSDLRQHLKHLGPSNLANKPRETKYKSVKIKPGAIPGTIPEGAATTTGAESPEATRSVSAEGHRSTAAELRPLLAAGGRAATGGVAALQAGYGTNPGSLNSHLRGLAETEQMPASEASQIAEENTAAPAAASPKSDRGSFRVPSTMIVAPDGSYTTTNATANNDDDDHDDDTVGDMAAPSRARSKSRRTARSGSITETTVDLNGVKKIVLDPQSSSDTESASPNGEASRSKENLKNGDGEKENGDGMANGGSADAKRKKKRGKKKKGGD
ncbi:cell agglutination protein Mam3 [Teratosphaeriaceae sp. CCFEE 6253]|nr:cell agglutination protein Mam3 [Teratosphaeriaceae sp. CCFEE 6253]